jgi:hypothetical protein
MGQVAATALAGAAAASVLVGVANRASVSESKTSVSGRQSSPAGSDPTHPFGTIIYVLRLEGNRRYVGKTGKDDMPTRFAKHMAGIGSAWTRMWPPIEVMSTAPQLTAGDEDEQTLRLMADPSLDIDWVRGGSFVAVDLSPYRPTIVQMLRTRLDTCFRCGVKGHFAAKCQQSTTWPPSTPTTAPTPTPRLDACFRCGVTGHFSAQCQQSSLSPSTLSSSSSPSSSPSSSSSSTPRLDACFRCGVTGHFAAKCQQSTLSSSTPTPMPIPSAHAQAPGSGAPNNLGVGRRDARWRAPFSTRGPWPYPQPPPPSREPAYVLYPTPPSQDSTPPQELSQSPPSQDSTPPQELSQSPPMARDPTPPSQVLTPSDSQSSPHPPPLVGDGKRAARRGHAEREAKFHAAAAAVAATSEKESSSRRHGQHACCSRCGRDTHHAPACYARTDLRGHKLPPPPPTPHPP